jgi:hypothetical protein
LRVSVQVGGQAYERRDPSPQPLPIKAGLLHAILGSPATS